MPAPWTEEREGNGPPLEGRLAVPDEMIAFGPVPSRRLGQSLGINNIPPKSCSYSCAYCQVGQTLTRTIDLGEFYAPDAIVSAVTARVLEIQRRREPLDFLTFVADGEPTLDIHLGREIELLRPLGVRVAVISNASLLWREEVRESLRLADWVSFKVDAIREEEWRRVNRPHPSLRLEEVLQGMLDFAAGFEGTLATETMLIAGVNDSDDSIAEVASFLGELRPSAAYLAIPTRPPLERWAQPASERSLTHAHQLLSDRLSRVELLCGDEGLGFGTTGDVAADLLSITSVHPMREDSVRALLAGSGSDWSLVERLMQEGVLAEIEYRSQTFYLRRWPRSGVPPATGAKEHV
jgi:wyosine [tRNA(Phe)-imidazoG37] synthetase (radical SAM superfamily)